MRPGERDLNVRSVRIPDVPDVIESERLTIMCPRLEDISALHAAVRESTNELRPWMAWARDDYSFEECERTTREAIARFLTRQDLRFHFHDRKTDELLGSTGLHRINWRVPRFEIGYWVRTSRAGRGYVTEAVRALALMAFDRLGAKRVEIRCDDENLASARVAEACGFGLDTVLRNWQRGPDGSLRHERVYSRLDSQGLGSPTKLST